MKLIMNMIQGFCMALADSVPGVSGGTVAFILGFYDRFIGSLNQLLIGKKEEKKQAIVFLAKLGAGWVIGFGSSVVVLGKIFDTHIYELCSLFIGFSVFALPLIIVEEKECMKEKRSNLIFLFLGILIVAALTYLHPSSSGNAVDLGYLSIAKGIYIFVAAAVAISAMVLPGISGSTLLLIFGLYVPIMNAIRSFLHFDLKVIPVLFIFGMGIIAGLIVCIRMVKAALEKHRAKMIYLILGLVTGSVLAIIQGPTTLKVPQSAMTWSTFHIGFFILGGVILGVLQLLKRFLEKKA